MSTLTLEPNDAVSTVMRKAFPSYNGRKFRLTVTENAGPFRSYWDGGSRTDYVILRLADNVTLPIPENGSGFVPELKTPDLPQPGFAVVAHSIFCGTDSGLTIMIHPDNATALLPSNSANELTHAELIVLTATRSLKSSYNGISDYRLHEAVTETGIKASEFRAARETCKAKGLLDSRGAITVKGKNAVGGKQLHELRMAGYDRWAPGSYERERELLRS